MLKKGSQRMLKNVFYILTFLYGAPFLICSDSSIVADEFATRATFWKGEFSKYF